MASTINADDGVISGSAGVKTTPDASGDLTLQTNGADRLKIGSAGNVGIGTSAPLAKLNVNGTDGELIRISVTSDAGVIQEPALGFATGVTNTYPAAKISALELDASDSRASLLFYTRNTNSDVAPTEQMQLTSSGDLKFNSGYGSVATAYGCRAWVNFNGTTNSNLSGTYSRTSPSTTLTVTATAHGLTTGNSVYLDFTTGTAVDGVYTVTVTGVNTFTVTTAASTTTSGNVTLVQSTIRASGNVSSVADVAAGQYAINFAAAMPDANYVLAGSSGNDGATASGRCIVRDGNWTTTTCQIRHVLSSTNAVDDVAYIGIAIFR